MVGVLSPGRFVMTKPNDARPGVLGRLRGKLDRRRQRRAEKARTAGEARREWERSGKVGHHGAHEGFTSDSGGF
jgi:hypothetical protein